MLTLNVMAWELDVPDVEELLIVVALVTEELTLPPISANFADTSAPTDSVVVLLKPCVVEALDVADSLAWNVIVCVTGEEPVVLSIEELRAVPFSSEATF